MREVTFCILMALVQLGGLADVGALIRRAGYTRSKFQVLAWPVIRANQWAHKVQAGRYEITERGKIALAIEVGRRTKRRAATHV